MPDLFSQGARDKIVAFEVQMDVLIEKFLTDQSCGLCAAMAASASTKCTPSRFRLDAPRRMISLMRPIVRTEAQRVLIAGKQ